MRRAPPRSANNETACLGSTGVSIFSHTGADLAERPPIRDDAGLEGLLLWGGLENCNGWVVKKGRQGRPGLNEKTDDPGPTPPRRPPKFAGTSYLEFATSSCTTLNNHRPNPAKERRVGHDQPALWSDLQTLHKITLGVRTPMSRRPSATLFGPRQVFSWIVYIFGIGWVVKMAVEKGSGAALADRSRRPFH